MFRLPGQGQAQVKQDTDLCPVEAALFFCFFSVYLMFVVVICLFNYCGGFLFRKTFLK